MIIDDQKIENILKSISRTEVPKFDLARVRNQILDRISITEVSKQQGFFGRFSSFVPMLRLGTGIVATLLIVVSLTLGTAVAALESVPGSAIYPLKKIVENIELRLTPSDQKTNLQLKFASNRAEELQQVLENNQDGKISDQQAQAIVANTVNDLQNSASAAVTSSKKSTKTTNIVSKLADISNKLRAASVQSEGQVKIELEKAIQANQVTQEEAIKNLENAGLKVDDQPIKIDDSITASGKLTAVSETSVSIGTAKFILTKDTKFVDIEAKDLKAGVIVDITGQIKDNISYALKITKISETKTETPAADPTPATP